MAAEKFTVTVDKDLEELIPEFLDLTNGDIKKMQQAVVSGDMEALRGLGHSMKGAGGGYGFDGLSEIGKGLEQAAKINDMETAKKHVEQAAAYMANVEIKYE